MADITGLPEWLWIVIEIAGDEERLLGQKDEEAGLSFVPAFNSAEDGQAVLNFLPKIPGRRYEIQAMRSAEVLKAARPNKYQVFLLDASGKILTRAAG